MSNMIVRSSGTGSILEKSVVTGRYLQLVADGEISITINYDGEPEAEYSPHARAALAWSVAHANPEHVRDFLDNAITATARETYPSLVGAFLGTESEVMALSTFWAQVTADMLTAAFDYALSDILDPEEVRKMLRAHKDYESLYLQWDRENYELDSPLAEANRDRAIEQSLAARAAH